jgi:hypothetical protein
MAIRIKRYGYEIGKPAVISDCVANKQRRAWPHVQESCFSTYGEWSDDDAITDAEDDMAVGLVVGVQSCGVAIPDGSFRLAPCHPGGGGPDLME